MIYAEDFMDAYLCQSCHTITETPDDILYECGSCGHRFKRSNAADGDSNRCPECNRFAAKVADHSCPDCDDGELEEIVAYPCPTCEYLHQQGEDQCTATQPATPENPTPSITVSPTGRSFHDLPVQLTGGLYIHDVQTIMDERAFEITGMSLRLSTWTIRSHNPENDWWEIIIEEKESYLLHTVSCTHCNVTTEHFDLRNAAEYVASGAHLHPQDSTAQDQPA